MKVWRVVAKEPYGRRTQVYRMDAETADEAREYCARYLAFLGVELGDVIEVVEEAIVA